MKDNPENKINKSDYDKRELQKFHDGERAILRKRIIKRVQHMDVEKLIHRSIDLSRKWLDRRRTQHPSKEKRPVFVVGCNRSGTNMVCGAIGKSPHAWDYRESAFSLAFNGYYLRQDWILEQLIRFTPAPIICFGSILESQSTDELISRFRGARAIWIYRNFEDVANSCARMQWGPTLKDIVRWVAHGELERIGARGRRITSNTVQLFGKLFREDISVEDGACLYWYMRNQLFFDLELNRNPRVLLLQYENSVLNQEKTFKRVFNFLGFPYDPVIIDGIYASSIGKNKPPILDQAIQEVCESLQAKLDTQFINSKDNDIRIST